MLIVNIVLLLLLAAFIAAGGKKGFLVTLGQLIGAVAGFLAARAWSSGLGVVIGLFMPSHAGLAKFIAFVIIFFIVERVIGFILSIVGKLFKLVTFLPIISSIDKLLGGLVGLLEGIVFVGSCVYIVLSLQLDKTLVGWLSGSVVAGYVERVFTFILGYFL